MNFLHEFPVIYLRGIPALEFKKKVQPDRVSRPEETDWTLVLFHSYIHYL